MRTAHGQTVHGVGRRSETAAKQLRNGVQTIRDHRSPTTRTCLADNLSSSIVSHF
jgi:hypothetical protein